ncbi:MAG: DUF2723 domain-containing protein [Chlorobi bacterium]|nr:DUF2723 domain-containing protein [Chlorobiota bacterium]
MNNFRKINLIAGWVIFAVASMVYLSTIEPTASFWDCGEFIASAYKLEVGHPPGAPFFMLIGRFFSLFAGANPAAVAKMINAWSALASGLTIMFLYWTIVHLARKVVIKDTEAMTTGQIFTVVGSGIIGALAYAFSDTFWFSAVEGEVYATSSLITALVFWAILKWENVADQPHSGRWIILIFYLIGLSIGVHLLNLLAIPAIVFVYYYRKYTPTPKGFAVALLVSIVLLGLIMYFFIPWTVRVGSWFELLFVNVFGLPFNSGVLVYLLLLGVGIYFGIRYSVRKKKVLLNTILLSTTMLLIGYSSYIAVVIRSNAEPPMDQNNPDNVFNLLYYLNREQYGERPLFKGQYYNAPIIDIKYTKPTYVKSGKKYKMISRKPEYIYDSRFTTIFPRMYSREAQHVRDYKYWAGTDGKKVTLRLGDGTTRQETVPTFGENLRFFFRYQVGFMYLRYFMWNFSGRQNDYQGHGDKIHGNWISGIPFIDNSRLGDQDKLPDYLKNNRARNRYFMFPLLLGLLGAVFHYRQAPKDFWIILLLFVFTGIAIVVYLNQYPHQPRERDYAYAGSFYAFTIWIGLGITALVKTLPAKINEKLRAIMVTLVMLVLVPGIMASENRDDHDRSGRYTARDFARNYLNSCAKDAILFTNGDNDTFPLWYVQEVEGFRTDVRVVNLSYLSADWYIDQLKRKAYDSDPVPFSLTRDKYVAGTRDAVLIQQRIPEYYNLEELMRFVADDNPKTRVPSPFGRDVMADFFPTGKFIIPVDTVKVRENGTVSPWNPLPVVKEIRWEMKREVVYKNTLMVLDLLSHNHWERPVYFAISIPSDSYIGLQDYFQAEGLAYRFVPVKAGNTGDIGRVDSRIMYENVMNRYYWGGVTDSSVYLDENNRRMLTNFRNTFDRLAEALISEGKDDSARKVLDRCVEIIPDRVTPFGYFSLPVLRSYYRLGETEKARLVGQQLEKNMRQELEYILDLSPRHRTLLSNQLQLDLHIYQQVLNITQQYDKSFDSGDWVNIFTGFVQKYQTDR